MKLYQVSPQEKNEITIGVFEKKQNTLKTESKKEALLFAQKLSKKYNSISFNCDTYKNGNCIKNEFGRYNKNNVFVYETINYKEPKKEKLNYKISDYFGQDVLSKI